MHVAVSVCVVCVWRVELREWGMCICVWCVGDVCAWVQVRREMIGRRKEGGGGGGGERERRERGRGQGERIWCCVGEVSVDTGTALQLQVVSTWCLSLNLSI